VLPVTCRVLLSASGKSMSCLNPLLDGTRKSLAVGSHLKIIVSLAEQYVLKVFQAKHCCMLTAAWTLQESEARSIENYPVWDDFPGPGMQYIMLLEGP